MKTGATKPELVIDENYSDDWIPPLKDIKKAITDKYLALCKIKGVDPYGETTKNVTKVPAFTTGLHGANANISTLWDNYRGKCLGCQPGGTLPTAKSGIPRQLDRIS